MKSFFRYVTSFFRGVKTWTKQAYHEWDKKDNLVQIQILTGLITIGTGVWAAGTYINQQYHANEIAKREDLATYQKYGDYLRQYRYVIQPNIASLLSEFNVSYDKVLQEKPEKKQKINILLLQPTEIQTLCRQGKIEKKYCYDQKNNSENPENSIQQQSDTKVFYFKIQKNPNPDLYDNTLNIYNTDKGESERRRFDDSCKALLDSQRNQTGMEVFFDSTNNLTNSSNFMKFREIHNFYESLGFAIKNKLVQFDTAFHLFVYPASWDDDEQRSIWATFDPFFEIETCLRKNWFGESQQEDSNKSLSDFSDNFLQLGTNYHYARLTNKYNSLNCKLSWQFWKQNPKEKDKKQCENLIFIRDKIEEEHIESNSAIKQLYDNPSVWVSFRKFWFHSNWLLIRIIIMMAFVGIIGWTGWTLHSKFTKQKKKSSEH